MGHKYHYSLAALFLFSYTMTSCDDEGLKADVPGFLTIEDVGLNATANQGSSSENIKDINIFIDDQSLGIFELPASVPVRKTGDINLKVRAFVRENGISDAKVNYPFFKTFELDTILEKEQEIHLNPTFQYSDQTIFSEPWSGEDFESGINFEYHPNSEAVFIRVTDSSKAFEGASGLAMLDLNETFFEARSPTFFDIPRNGTPIFMELDYKSTHDFAVSLYSNGQSVQTRVVFLRSRDDWTKVYIELGSIISSLAGAINFNIAIGYLKLEGEIGELMVDNVKLLHF